MEGRLLSVEKRSFLTVSRGATTCCWKAAHTACTPCRAHCSRSGLPASRLCLQPTPGSLTGFGVWEKAHTPEPGPDSTQVASKECASRGSRRCLLACLPPLHGSLTCKAACCAGPAVHRGAAAPARPHGLPEGSAHGMRLLERALRAARRLLQILQVRPAQSGPAQGGRGLGARLKSQALPQKAAAPSTLYLIQYWRYLLGASSLRGSCTMPACLRPASRSSLSSLRLLWRCRRLRGRPSAWRAPCMACAAVRVSCCWPGCRGTAPRPPGWRRDTT